MPNHSFTATISREDALKIAKLDAEKAYRDLSPYHAIVSLEEDGWHVQFKLNNPNQQGGGAFYIIDSVKGKINKKIYQQ